MSDYQFVTVWNIDAPVWAVWDIIEDADAWPDWWRGVIENVEIRAGDENGVGSIRRMTWKSALPYKLRFDSEIIRLERHRLIEGLAVGELEGRGLWQFEPTDTGGTRLQYDWTVVTNKAWMNVLAPAARPFFRWNHDIIMGWGEDGLKRRLAAYASGQLSHH